MSNLVIFETNGEQVVFDPAAEMWSLTAMHQAAGAPKHKEPYVWLRQQQARDFVAALAARLNLIQDQVYPDPGSGLPRSGLMYNEAGDMDEGPQITPDMLVQTRPGRYAGGTWAHWQIAAAYAHYLDPHFYIQWNEWALAYRTGQPAPPPTPDLAALTARVAALEAQAPALTIRPVEVLSPTGPLHPQAQAILAIFAAAQGGPLAISEVIRALRRAGVPMTNPTQVRVRIRRMATRGQLRRCGRGWYEQPARQGA